MKTIYIGIDPDLRRLNCALLLDDPPVRTVLAVFLRRNKTKQTGDMAVSEAVKIAELLVDDVLNYFIKNSQYQMDTITMIAESQSMQHQRHSKHEIDPDDILRTGQIIGVLMGSFSSLVENIHLVQPARWKGQLPKEIHHPRIYKKLGLDIGANTVKSIVPLLMPELVDYSGDKINPGDFSDINDSIGLALYGAENNL